MKKAQPKLSAAELRKLKQFDFAHGKLNAEQEDLERDIICRRAPCQIGDVIEFEDTSGNTIKGIVTFRRISFYHNAKIVISYRKIARKRLQRTRLNVAAERVRVVEKRSDKTIAMLRE